LAKERTPTQPSDIDALANEIFARLNDENRNDAVEDLQLQLTRAASTLVRPNGAAEAVVNATLQGLPSNQRDVLLLHLSGLTCTQIADQQARMYQAVLKDLTSAYVRLRFSLYPVDQTDAKTPADGALLGDDRSGR
jgi:DNA-directed RNA polymerase specialized sigma24 family protein